MPIHSTTPRQPKYRAALFDLDDTLFDHQLHRREALAALANAIPALQRLSIKHLEHAHDRHLQRTHNALLAGLLTLEQARTERLRGLLAEFGLAADDGQVEIAEAAYRLAYDTNWRAVPGAHELLRKLRELGIVIVVITNGRSIEQASKIDALGLRDKIDAMFVSEAVRAQKPSLEFFNHVLTAHSLSPGECVVVGDLWETDIQGALNSGIDAIWLNRYERSNPCTPAVSEITSMEPLDDVLRLFLHQEKQQAIFRP